MRQIDKLADYLAEDPQANIRKLRHEAGISQRRLAVEAIPPLAVRTVEYIEGGHHLKPYFSTLYRISGVLLEYIDIPEHLR